MKSTSHILTLAFIVLFNILHTITFSQKIIYQFDIHQEISPAVSRITMKAIEEAEKKNAAFILVDMDSYGGLVEDADIIRSALLKTKIPTIAFIKNNAASAGALISIACDSIYMRGGSTIGAASVVNQTGEVMPEKYQSYMRKKIRATAEETGRNPLIAEAMVDGSIEIPNVKPAGKIVTFSVDEAVKNGYCNAKVENIKEILERLNGQYIIEKQEFSWFEKLILLLCTPAVSGILLLGIFAGIYFEFKAPGTLLPIGFSVLCAALYFGPLYFDGLAANWEILLFFAGLILLALEIFVIPGFGVTGISGIVLVLAGLTLAMVRNINFDFTFVPEGNLGTAFLMVSLAMALPLILLLAFGHNIFNSPVFNWMSVKGEMKADSGFSVKEDKLNEMIGKRGVTITDLRPVGKIQIGDERFEASADGFLIEINHEVTVVGIRGNYLIVKE